MGWVLGLWSLMTAVAIHEAGLPGILETPNVAQDREEQHIAPSASANNSDAQQRTVWEGRA